MKMLPVLMADFYKVGHPAQYPEDTRVVYSNLTPRKSRLPSIDKMVFFGLQYFMKEYLLTKFRDEFFNVPKEEVLRKYKRRVRTSLGGDLPSYDHIEKLHDLQYLPIKIKALPEGVAVGMRVPVLTITNTLPEHYWLPNFLETILSCIVWQPCTSATIAHEYKKKFVKWAKITGMPMDFIMWQGHDFSFRGMSSLETAITSGMGHLTSSFGTDTIPAIEALEEYYNANADTEMIGGSVNATEHSVMCAGSKGGELQTFQRLLEKVYPNGILSVVSDTWDLWYVLMTILPQLKDSIMKRDGKLVIRPDSGDPVDIICGKAGYKAENGVVYKWVSDYKDHGSGQHSDNSGWRKTDEVSVAEAKGVIELLWDVFGGTLTSTGYKLLDSHIGSIYGDSITLDRAEAICQRLADKGFASQVVFGIGSYTYQYNTRDTFGTAMKATYVEIGEESHEIWKDPITDDGTKKSATGLLRVDKVNGEYVLRDRVTKEEAEGGELQTVFLDGKLLVDHKLSEIRERLAALAAA